MKKDRVVKRLQRLARQASRDSELNIVSLIDIFAILVFYLLVNALVVEILPNPQALKLPESVIQEEPRENTLVQVTLNDVLVNNRRVMSLSEALAAEGNILPALKSELMAAPLMQTPGAGAGMVTRGEVNIMADKAIPYQILKKVMATCTETRFAKISLAVIEKHGAGGGQ
ncbi:biopolymer transporter ExbD [Solimonas sp. SE-A11]|uniref:ExbD/TolR family protein n=1 Tax=Solimonas sp. SE-A11 TaxID=3054954 RepID=UPI00259D0DEF|nr:biopolymer transporter ExbD [Solimonas sp. SE-A11]MDM4768821.1 biopolymer transporter ExbD [Solimonas sp. SE-A11]